GRRVLLVDLDPQGSATVSLGFQKSKLLYTVYDALAQSRKIEEVMLGTKVENLDRKSTRLNSSHVSISYAVFCLKKKIFFTELLIGHYSSIHFFAPHPYLPYFLEKAMSLTLYFLQLFAFDAPCTCPRHFPSFLRH